MIFKVEFDQKLTDQQIKEYLSNAFGADAQLKMTEEDALTGSTIAYISAVGSVDGSDLKAMSIDGSSVISAVDIRSGNVVESKKEKTKRKVKRVKVKDNFRLPDTAIIIEKNDEIIIKE